MLFQPAIFYAEHGIPVPEMIHDYWSCPWRTAAGQSRKATASFSQATKCRRRARSSAIPTLPKPCASSPTQGEAGLLQGAIAQAILKTSAEQGGTMTADDLAQYSAEWVEPISTTYRDWTVYELPPNGDGMAALEMLNIMEQFPA